MQRGAYGFLLPPGRFHNNSTPHHRDQGPQPPHHSAPPPHAGYGSKPYATAGISCRAAFFAAPRLPTAGDADRRSQSLDATALTGRFHTAPLDALPLPRYGEDPKPTCSEQAQLCHGAAGTVVPPIQKKGGGYLDRAFVCWISPRSMMTSAEAVAPLDVSRVRVVLSRIIFRGMLFVMGTIAIAMYRLIPNKNVTWAFCKMQARNLMRLCGVRVHMRGLEHLGAGPYIFTPNHQSHFDIAALLGYLPGNNRFAAKKEMFSEPVLGAALRTLGMLPIDRQNPMEAIEILRRLKTDDYSTIIFPEGTRSRDGTLLPFKKGPFIAAIGLGIPVVPVACKGTQQVMPKG